MLNPVQRYRLNLAGILAVCGRLLLFPVLSHCLLTVAFFQVAVVTFPDHTKNICDTRKSFWLKG